MKYEEIFKYVSENYINCRYKFIVTIKGKKYKKRLFIYADSYICEFKKNSRKRGTIVFDYKDWESITVNNETEKSDYDYLIQTAKKAVSYLGKSGLWSSFKSDLEFFIKTDKTIMEEVINGGWDKYMEFKRKNSLCIGGDMFFNLISVGIKTVRYDKFLRDYQIDTIKKSIDNKVDFTLRWRNVYDNSIEIKSNKYELCGWYSEEYKGCANGYYYFLIDEKHVLFAEKD